MDSRRPRIFLASGFALLLGGSDIYDSGLAPDDNFLRTSSLHFPDWS